MTLVIGLVSRTFAIQVGDRLLTSGDNSFRDPLANKSVVILGHDGFACISYSGVAYIGKRPGKRMPTDQWLAEIAFGRSTTPEPMLPGDVPPVAMFDSSFVPSLGQALERIRTAFSTDLQPNVHKDDRDKFGLQLLVSGFVGRPTPDGKNMRPILSRMLYDENHPLRFKEDTAPRHWE